MVEIDFQNVGGKLKPGMFASVRLPVNASGEGSLYVPKSAIISTIGCTFVVKVVNDKAIQTDVQKGEATVGHRHIFGNFKPGDVILKTASEDIDDQTPIKTLLVN